MLPIICIRIPGTRDIRYFQIKVSFASIRALLITSAKKFIFPAKRTHHTNFRQATITKMIFKGFFVRASKTSCTCVDPFFYSDKSWCWKTHHI